MTPIKVPKKYLIIGKAQCGSMEELKTLIMENEPNLPLSFISTMTIVIGRGMPNVTGVHKESTVDDLADRIYRLYNDPDIIAMSEGETADLSVILFYNAELEAVICYVGNLEEIQPVSEDVFISQQVGQC
jgi:hypothetical protein